MDSAHELGFAFASASLPSFTIHLCMEDLDFGCFTLEHRCGFILHQDTVKESIEGDLAGFEPQSLLRNKYQRKEDEKGGQPLLPAFKICFVDKSEKQF